MKLGSCLAASGLMSGVAGVFLLWDSSMVALGFPKTPCAYDTFLFIIAFGEGIIESRTWRVAWMVGNLSCYCFCLLYSSMKFNFSRYLAEDGHFPVSKLISHLLPFIGRS